jgi:hypothetical protein
MVRCVVSEAEGPEPGDELVAFFRALSAAARREYEGLAELDRRFGEDVESEQRARAQAERS